MFNKEKAIYATFAIQILILLGLVFSAFTYFNPTGSKFKSNSAIEEDYYLESSPAPRSFSKKMKMSSPMGNTLGSSLLVEVAEASEQSSKYLVKTGNIRGRVDSLEDHTKTLKNLLKDQNALIESENQSRYNQSINLDLTIKVPVNNFESLMTSLAESASFLDSKSSNVIDKFKEFTDITENIKNQSLLRDKFRNILKNAKKVKDLLEIERELANVQRRIDGYKRQLNSLKDRIARSTISASFYETLPLSEQKNQISFLRQFSNSIVKGLTRTKSFFLWLISIWPFILIVMAAVYYFCKKK